MPLKKFPASFTTNFPLLPLPSLFLFPTEKPADENAQIDDLAQDLAEPQENEEEEAEEDEPQLVEDAAVEEVLVVVDEDIFEDKSDPFVPGFNYYYYWDCFC